MIREPITQLTADAARRKVTRFVATRISTQMHGEPPNFVEAESVWRVPVMLSMPPSGNRGVVGEIDVDAQSGAVRATETVVQEIVRRAELLAQPAVQKTRAVR